MPDYVKDGRWLVQTHPFSIPGGWRPLDVFYGTHGNAYLGLVLAWNEAERTFVVWIWNRESGGFGEGDYYQASRFINGGVTFEEALRFQLKAATDSFRKKRDRWVEHFISNSVATEERDVKKES